jgi:hypothetical protein
MKVVAVLFTLLSLSPAAFAGVKDITEECDTPDMRGKIIASIQDSIRVVDGKVDAASVKITNVMPKQLLSPGRSSVLATAEVSFGDGEDAGLFAMQFSMNYDTCEPKFEGSGRLQ